MGVIEIADELRDLERLDAVWIQAGCFMELHGESALAMSEAYGLKLWHRGDTPTVGIPVTHIEKWAQNTANLGLATGFAVGSRGSYELTRFSL